MMKTLKPCGTYAAYMRHYKNKEIACDLCKVAVNEYQQTMKTKHKNNVLKRNREYHYKNRDFILERKKEYSKINKEVSRRGDRKRRALKLQNGFEPYTEQQVLETYGTNCNICNLPVDLTAPRRVGIPGWQNGLHIDHVIPVSKGGPDILSNVRATHGLCNITKNNKEQSETTKDRCTCSN